MQILLSCAKDMATTPPDGIKAATTPRFADNARQTAVHMMKYSADELARMLKVNPQLAALNKMRYHAFLEPAAPVPALFAYTGIAFKHLLAEPMDGKQLAFAAGHLWITSFLYGLLRPLDGIRPYRLEGTVRLPEYGNQRMFDYWKPLLTDVLIDSVRNDDGILLNVASAEMKQLFEWQRVESNVSVIEPDFMVYKNGIPKTVVVYAKMCRGAMARHAIDTKARTINALCKFNFEGFGLDSELSQGGKLVFTLR